MKHSDFEKFLRKLNRSDKDLNTTPLECLCRMACFEEEVDGYISLCREHESMEKATEEFLSEEYNDFDWRLLQEGVLKESGAYGFFAGIFYNTLEVLKAMGNGEVFTKAWLKRSYRDSDKEYLFIRWLNDKYYSSIKYVWLGDDLDELEGFGLKAFNEKAKEMGYSLPRKTQKKASREFNNKMLDKLIREAEERNREKIASILIKYWHKAPSDEEWEKEGELEPKEIVVFTDSKGKEIEVTKEEMKSKYPYLYNAYYELGMITQSPGATFFIIVEDKYNGKNLKELFPDGKQYHKHFCNMADIRTKTGKRFNIEYAKKIKTINPEG